MSFISNKVSVKALNMKGYCQYSVKMDYLLEPCSKNFALYTSPITHQYKARYYFL